MLIDMMEVGNISTLESKVKISFDEDEYYLKRKNKKYSIGFVQLLEHFSVSLKL